MSHPKEPSAILINSTVITNAQGGAAIRVADGEHLQARGLTALTNQGAAFQLDTSGTVDADGVVHSTTRTPPRQNAPPRSKFRKRGRK